MFPLVGHADDYSLGRPLRELSEQNGLAACTPCEGWFFPPARPAWVLVGNKLQVSSQKPVLRGLLWPSVVVSLFYVLSVDSL